MTDRVRILSGFIEIDHVRVAQLLPKVDERDVSEHLLGHPDDYDRGYNEGESDGYFSGKQDGADEGKSELNKNIEATLERLNDEGKISKIIYDLLCEELPSE